MQSADGHNVDEVLQLKAKVAELELHVAQKNDQIQELKGENTDLAGKVQKASNAVSSRVTSVKDENYQLQKELMTVQEEKHGLEAQLSKAQESTAAIQSSIAKEVQRARDEAERQALFLRSQLMEQKELNVQLQERLVTTVNLAESLRGAGMDEFATERILITSDAVLHRLTLEHRNAKYKGKYDVGVEITGRHMTLSGKKLNVQLLKAEVLQVLNDMYAGVTEPNKYIAGAKVKDEAQRAETDHLRRTIITHESTIASLHTALQHAQDRTNQAIRDSDACKRTAAVSGEEAKAANQLRDLERAELNRTIEQLNQKLADAEATGNMGMESLRAEAEVSRRYREENETLRQRLHEEIESKEVAQRTVYVAAEKLKATQDMHSELQHHVRTADASLAKSASQDAEIQKLSKALEQKQIEYSQRVEQLSRDSGSKTERLQSMQVEINDLRAKRSDLEGEKDQLQRELAAVQESAAELRNRLSLYTTSNEEDGARGRGDLSRIARLEEENAALREELQRAFADMKTVATSIRDTRSVRERAIADLERVEIERSSLLDERQQLEMELVQERMRAAQRESDLEHQTATLREEVEHQKRRVEMLHVEYQRKLAEALPGSAVDSSAVSAVEALSQDPDSAIAAASRPMTADSPMRPNTHVPQRTPLRTGGTPHHHASGISVKGIVVGGAGSSVSRGASPSVFRPTNPGLANPQTLHSPSPPPPE